MKLLCILSLREKQNKNNKKAFVTIAIMNKTLPQAISMFNINNSYLHAQKRVAHIGTTFTKLYYSFISPLLPIIIWIVAESLAEQ